MRVGQAQRGAPFVDRYATRVSISASPDPSVTASVITPAFSGGLWEMEAVAVYRLYVVLTRVSALHIVHAGPLPAVLQAP